MKSNSTPKPLSHLTAVHMLGRILERIDQSRHASAAGCQRYQYAMHRLSKALDQVEQGFVMREVLDTYSSGYRA
jgi:hypothetical protein